MRIIVLVSFFVVFNMELFKYINLKFVNPFGKKN